MKFALVFAVALLAGCTSTGQPSAQTQAAIAKLCAQDAALQPVAVADLQTVQLMSSLAGVAVPPAAVVSNDVGQAVSLDQSLVHPLVVQMCAKLAPPAAS